MPTAQDVRRFLAYQAFGRTVLPDCDLSGKTIIITGANTGLGFDSAMHLTRMNVSNVIFACRSLDKGKAAKSKILSEAGSTSHTSIDVWEVVLDECDSVVAFCKRVSIELDRVDGLIANAGIESETYEQSGDLERTLKVNVVSTFLMVIAILPKLQETASKYGVDTRLSIVGSLIHYMAPDNQLDVSDDMDILAALSDPTTADMTSRYPLSKLIVHQVFNRLVDRLSTQDNQVIVNLVNRGWCGTELGRNKRQGLFERISFRILGRTCEEGSRTLVHAVTAGRETHAKYLSECMVAPQSDYMESEKGKRVGEILFGETLERIRVVDAGVARHVM